MNAHNDSEIQGAILRELGDSEDVSSDTVQMVRNILCDYIATQAALNNAREKARQMESDYYAAKGFIKVLLKEDQYA